MEALEIPWQPMDRVRDALTGCLNDSLPDGGLQFYNFLPPVHYFEGSICILILRCDQNLNLQRAAYMDVKTLK